MPNFTGNLINFRARRTICGLTSFLISLLPIHICFADQKYFLVQPSLSEEALKAESSRNY